VRCRASSLPRKRAYYFGDGWKSTPDWYPELGIKNVVNAVATGRRDANHGEQVARESDCLTHDPGVKEQ
jgi:hypothetical protein